MPWVRNNGKIIDLSASNIQPIDPSTNELLKYKKSEYTHTRWLRMMNCKWNAQQQTKQKWKLRTCARIYSIYIFPIFSPFKLSQFPFSSSSNANFQHCKTKRIFVCIVNIMILCIVSGLNVRVHKYAFCLVHTNNSSNGDNNNKKRSTCLLVGKKMDAFLCVNIFSHIRIFVPHSFIPFSHANAITIEWNALLYIWYIIYRTFLYGEMEIVHMR